MAEALPTVLRAYLGATTLLEPVAPWVLHWRLRRGKEDPVRWREKLGAPSAPRPEGQLVWMHAVGLGEVMALRGLIARMAGARPDLSFLVTSTARSSGEVFARNLPAHTQHQYLPLDLPGAAARFLAHWRPDLSVWAEQDLWPGLVARALLRDVPVALVNARMDATSFAARNRWRGVYAPLLARMSCLSAQDAVSARHLERLGGRNVAVTGTLKAAAPPLGHDAGRLAAMRVATAGRTLWLLASSHPEDEAVALAAHRLRLASDPGSLLLIVPRDVRRGENLVRAAGAAGLRAARLGQVTAPEAGVQVFVADSYGEMGLWLRLCPVALIGGTYGPVEGHNPWEAVRLGAAVLHGPRVANFQGDYRALGPQGALMCPDPQAVASALARDFTAQRAHATRVAEAAARGADQLAANLLALIGRRG